MHVVAGGGVALGVFLQLRGVIHKPWTNTTGSLIVVSSVGAVSAGGLVPRAAMAAVTHEELVRLTLV